MYEIQLDKCDHKVGTPLLAGELTGPCKLSELALKVEFLNQDNHSKFFNE